MRVRAIVDERFEDYKLPCLFIAAAFCDWKCPKELGLPTEICQNEPLAKMEIQEVEDRKIVGMYLKNPITKAIVFGGLEPFCQWDEMIRLIGLFREDDISDPIIIYTGYNRSEIESKIEQLAKFPNIIVKFGRFIPGGKPHYDEVLNVNLISDNQYAEVIS